IDFDLDLAVGIFLGKLLELFGRLPLGRIGSHDMAELDDDRRLRPGCSRQSQRRDRNGGQYQFAHVSSGSTLFAERANGTTPEISYAGSHQYREGGRKAIAR